MIKIKKKYQCCGCSACASICPQKCITMIEDNEGFLYPQVNKTSCIDCKLCEKTCPHQNPLSIQAPQKIYAAINRNSEIRLKSSSGGVFYEIAKNTIKNGGYVYGVCYDNNWLLTYKGINTINELSQLMGSKYIQCNPHNIFIDVKKHLAQGTEVLFCGTPCIIAGLNKYLKKDYTNLLTIELLCHGVPSPLVWQLYLNELLMQQGITKENINSISFRKKIVGKKEYMFSIMNKEGDNYQTFFYENAYMKAFLSNLMLRPSCYSCKAKEGHSHADLTIGDLWDTYNCPPYNDSNGTSIILINSPKGEHKVNDSNLIISQINERYINSTNSGFYSKQYINPNRKFFFSQLNKIKNGEASIIDLMNELSKLKLYHKIIKKIHKIIFHK